MNQKNISVLVVIISLLVLALIGYGIMSSSQSADTINKDTLMQKDVMAKDEMMMKDESMMADKEVVMQNDAPTIKEVEMVAKSGSYMSYDAAKVTLAAQTGKAVLFFHASWCPTCRAADAEFLKMANSIPTGVTIFKTDYDSSSELKKKYGVTTQHTFVQVDAQGGVVNSWRSSASVADIIAKIK